jgi:hypothetical protein
LVKRRERLHAEAMHRFPTFDVFALDAVMINVYVFAVHVAF